MSNWKSFDESPKCHPMLVQVSDFEVIWLENYHEVKDKKNCVWKEPIFDELPKKPPHRCYDSVNHIQIREIDNKFLQLIIPISPSHFIYIPVKFCPICGYSIKKDEFIRNIDSSLSQL